MNLLTENLKKVDMFNDILESLKSENKAISFKNIMDIQKAYYVYSLTTNNDKSMMLKLKVEKIKMIECTSCLK